jgi:hypothetical protein
VEGDIVTDIAGGGKSETTDEAPERVGEDTAEEVRGYDHVAAHSL